MAFFPPPRRRPAAPGEEAPLRRFAFACAIVGFGTFAAFAISMVATLNSEGFEAQSINIDFSVFWGAARLALAGDWSAAFDMERLADARGLPSDDLGRAMPWSYPPAFHVLIAPLGALPFSVAWFVFNAASISLFAWAVRGPARAIPGGIVFVLAAPATLLTLVLGQNTILISALIVLMLSALHAGRWGLAGIAIGLLTIKPQFGLLIPVILLCAGMWRAILAAVLASMLVIALTLIEPGTAYWRAFFENIAASSGYLADGRYPDHIMITWYRALTELGVPRDAAMWGQAAIGVLFAAAVGWLWSRDRTSQDLKSAAFCLAVPLVTPYALYYDLMLAVLGALYLARSGMGSTLGGRLLMLMLWLSPILGGLLLQEPGFTFSAPLMTIAFLACIVRACKADAPG